jgi:phosphatidylserine/phosphatidylglycerophosphate/cardiolipin synthase-like enzyme
MTPSPKRKKTLQINVSPTVAIICSLILGVSYFGVEVYQHHNSYHEVNGIWRTCFTPNQKCQQLIIQNINEAKESIRLQGYSFTDMAIADALVKAHQRNVDVKVILDHSNLKTANLLLQELIKKQIRVKIDKPQGIAHNKILIVDNRIVLTGSYNFSTAAYKRNTENLLIIHDPKVAGEYLTNWQTRWDVSMKTSPTDLNKKY